MKIGLQAAKEVKSMFHIDWRPYPYYVFSIWKKQNKIKEKHKINKPSDPHKKKILRWTTAYSRDRCRSFIICF